MQRFDLGEQLVSKYEPGVTATVVDAKLLNGILHYRLKFQPRGYAADPCWLSEYGIAIDFMKATAA